MAEKLDDYFLQEARFAGVESVLSQEDKDAIARKLDGALDGFLLSVNDIADRNEDQKTTQTELMKMNLSVLVEEALKTNGQLI